MTKLSSSVDRKFTQHLALEVIMSSIICINVVCLAIHLQLEGESMGHQLGLRNYPGGFSTANRFFDVQEKCFSGIYLIEMSLRLWVFHSGFRVVAKGPNSQENKGKLGIFGPPRPNNNMPTPCPYILMQWTEQGAAAFGRCSLWCA